MFTAQQKVQCLLWYAEMKWIVSVHQRFRVRHRSQNSPDGKAVRRWFYLFRDTGSLLKGHLDWPAGP
ncbi:hypothetical protein J6590_020897, partial [Homalodisca vitripennis]